MSSFVLLPFSLPFQLLSKIKLSGDYFFNVSQRELTIDYVIRSEMRDSVDLASFIDLPPLLSEKKRKDLLWQKTCFEFFLKADHHPFYVEFNLSPEGSWNCYSFDDYRQGMNPLSSMVADDFNFEMEKEKIVQKNKKEGGGNQWQFKARINLAKVIDQFLAKNISPEKIKIAPTAVLEHLGIIENSLGNQPIYSYWSMNHPHTDRPDFHYLQNLSLPLL